MERAGERASGKGLHIKAMPGECINVHVGQAGVQMGTACWHQFCLEHGVTETGQRTQDSPNTRPDCPANFFRETESGRYIPRAVFTDLHPSAQGIVRSSAYGSLFDPEQTVVFGSDAAGLYSRGYYSYGKEHLEMTVEAIRHQAEKSDNVTSFLIQRSLGGGTGSGFGSLLMERLTGDFPKAPLLEVAAYPSAGMSPFIVEPYNTTLTMHTGLEFTNTACSFLFHNDTIFNLCRGKLDMDCPRYPDINSVISSVVSSLTASMRYPESMLVSQGDAQVDMTPLPRVHFPIVSYAPLTPPDVQHHDQKSLLSGALTGQVLQQENALVRCDNTKAKVIAYSGLYRGAEVTEADLPACSEALLWGLLESVDWLPGGTKVTSHSHPLVAPPGAALGNPRQTATVISNSTAVGNLWCSLGADFEALFSRRAFVHWFLEEGMDECELLEAREDLATLVNDYADLATVATGTPREPGSLKKGRGSGPHL